MNQTPHAEFDAILDQVGSVFVGHRPMLRKVLAAALANGNVLFEDAPGLGKTLLVKALSKALGCASDRIQFTPDLMPGDIVGTKIWDAQKANFRLEKGPVFTNILLADEINRAPPKAQSALLEAMEERQVTIEGRTFPLESPFFCLATQNPLESEGTYPLPDAQMDRFLMRMSMGYAQDLDEEATILRRRVAWQRDDPTDSIKPVTSAKRFREMQRMAETEVFVHDDLLVYMARLVRSLRKHPALEIGPSPRGALALLRVSRALALVGGRTFVTPDDVRSIAADCLAHRCIVQLDQALEGYRPEAAVDEALRHVPVPADMGRPGTRPTDAGVRVAAPGWTEVGRGA